MRAPALFNPRPSMHVLALVIAGMLITCFPAQAQLSHSRDLGEMKLEDLMNVQVTSVSKKEQKVSHAASAIYVITQEDIRHSGATNIPDLLRMVPGVNVAQIGGSTWAISARGFNRQFSNKLLVLLDGRSVYLPTTGGVFWDVFDVPLEDIERIEVIRGPGGSTWGANAVNGVINIITKKASETRGGLVVAGAGSLNQGFGLLQGGASLGRRTDFRVFGKYDNHSPLPSWLGGSADDPWHVLKEGFRSDTQISKADALTVQGELYADRTALMQTSIFSFAHPQPQVVYLRYDMSGGYIQSQWNHHSSEHGDTSLRAAFDHYFRPDALAESRNTVNLEFQHQFSWESRQDFVWGIGYRGSTSVTQGSGRVLMGVANRNTSLFSLFVQDEVAIVPARVSLTLGTKLERDYYTGFALMPSARATWQINPHHMMWAAISHAVRTPSVMDESMEVNLTGFVAPDEVPVVLRAFGSPQVKNENVTAYETGY